jgi:ATP-dependent DNA helicase RecG
MTVQGTQKQTEVLQQQTPAQYVRGIGPRRFEALKRLGILTVRDLCYFFPNRYEDRAQFKNIVEITENQEVTIQGKILSLELKPTKKSTLLEALIGDETETILAVWFNQPFLKNKLHEGDTVVLSGKVEEFRGTLQMSSPEYEIVQNSDKDFTHAGRIIPVYPLTEGLIQRSLRQAMKEVVERHIPKEIREFLPENLRRKRGLISLHCALSQLHFPDTWDLIKQATTRIVYDEFLMFELALISKIRLTRSKEKGLPLICPPDFFKLFTKMLEFELTEDQKQAIRDITKELAKPVPMNRLLQGEVGTGKTIVAAYFLAVCAQAGYQACLVAPTEILSEQHYQRLNSTFSKLNIKTFLLTGSATEPQRLRIYERIRNGEIGIFIGTHALLQEDVNFSKLGLVIIDEQHRFGVEQRAKLVTKNPRPHLLVMTATPIPRTLGLTLYGDFSITVIREQPKGRKPIKTYWIHKDKEGEVLRHIRKIVTSTEEQAYILFPIIDESEHLDVQAATKEFERLRNGIFKNISIGLLHGRLSKKDRDKTMGSFQIGLIKVLVATSLIEVGVDNPNVTFMVIENAERFGLSQLHQMRGRIGRGHQESMCFLFGNPNSDESKKRLRILTKTNDGFQIAEEDLALRGPGDFFGTQQSGLAFFKLANFIRDANILSRAKEDATHILEQDPNLIQLKHKFLADELQIRRAQVEI